MKKFFYVFIILFLTNFLNQIVFAKNSNFNGIWFECEFSIFGAIPLDSCKMLDDDGFLVEDGKLFHLKVKNSKEHACRSNRVGHCFSMHMKLLEVSKSKIGKIDVSNENINVKYMGCKQKYWIIDFLGFWKVFPDEKRCFWAKEKVYYVRKWEGKLLIQ